MTLLRLNLYRHVFLETPELPPMPGPLVYVVAAKGVFLWARRDEMEALIPVQECAIRSLYPVTPFVRIAAPLLPAIQLTQMLALAREACFAEQGLREALFYPAYDPTCGWQVGMPVQERGCVSVRPLLTDEAQTAMYTSAWWEIHSHHRLPAFFSDNDDEDAQGFRLDGVLGRIFSESAQLRMRVSLYGHYWAFPASWVCELPSNISDILAVEQALAGAEQEEETDGQTTRNT